jgi:hypothetical protein
MTRYIYFTVALLISFAAQAQTTNTETIVCIRHGEKPSGGLGQLTCQGLNRALALPPVLLAKYGQPNYIFAPNPSQKSDKGQYNYVRPLITIEPTAIQCGLPVDTTYGYKEIVELQTELHQPKYQSATIFVAWEHFYLDKFAQSLIARDGGNTNAVPAWPDKDFDTIFVFKIQHVDGHSYASLQIDHEGLNGLPTDCPK